MNLFRLIEAFLNGHWLRHDWDIDTYASVSWGTVRKCRQCDAREIFQRDEGGDNTSEWVPIR